MVSIQFRKNFTGRPFCGGWTKIFKLLADISFDSSLQNTALPSLLLFLCACYWIDPDNIQWNEVTTSTAHNFNNNCHLYLNFSNMINLCPNIWFMKSSKCQEPPKNHKSFIFLQGRYFVMGGPIDMNIGVFWETSAGFLKSVVLQLFPKYSQSNVKLNVKNRWKFNCL